MTSKEVTPLPPSPDLKQYKKQAKELVKAHNSGDTEARRRVNQNHPRFGKLSDLDPQGAKFALADAQLVIAREHGFESWPKFVRHMEAVIHTSPRLAVWRSAEDAVISGDLSTLDQLLRENPTTFRDGQPPPYVPRGPRPNYASADAREIISGEHQFSSWEEFCLYVEALAEPDSAGAWFEAGVEAVVNGAVATLEQLLRKNPDLIRARSRRTHHATLLHYVGANGIEGFRQKTPKNAVDVARVLLEAGAEVDSTADLYGGTTTLGLVATSIHARIAGVQGELIDLLLDHRSVLDVAVASTYTAGSVVNACLANGRPESAELLAKRGAQLDLEGSAGVGRLDLVRGFFDENGNLKANATKAQMEAGFRWACEYGRSEVVNFLLDRGVDISAGANTGLTGLHWAVVGGQMETINLLLKRGAPLEAKNAYGGTVLDQALWCLVNGDPGIDCVPIIETLIAAGAIIDPGSLAWLANQDTGSPTVKKSIVRLLSRRMAES